MRVISGSARGIRLETIDGMDTRPTTDRVKESLFNLIQYEIMDEKVLDLFSGSGGLGIEAGSRGASQVVLVEQSRKCEKAIRQNIEKTKLGDKVQLLVADVQQALGRLADRGPFHLVMMDPPYNKGLVEPAVTRILELGLLEDDGLIVVEHAKGEDIPETIGALTTIKLKKYGNTMIRIYGRKTA